MVKNKMGYYLGGFLMKVSLKLEVRLYVSRHGLEFEVVGDPSEREILEFIYGLLDLLPADMIEELHNETKQQKERR